VYKTVSVLKKMNEILELGFPDGSNRYDGKRPYPHPHMICTKCKEILDPDLSILNELTEEMGKKTGYRILFHRLDFFGLCPKCPENYKIIFLGNSENRYPTTILDKNRCFRKKSENAIFRLPGEKPGSVI
jgi:hypothetical protein